MKQLKKTILTLVALLALTTGAWAEEQSETITTATKGTTVYTGTHFKITASYNCDADGIYLFSNNHGTATIESLNGENITKIEMHMTYGGRKATKTTTTAGQLVATDSSESANDISVINVNATSVEIGTTVEALDGTVVQIDKFVIYYGAASSGTSGPKVAWNAEAKTGSFTMPGGNVTLEPEYYPQATLAFQGLTAAVDAAAKTEAPLAVLADGAVTGGTLMYYVATDKNFSQADAIALAETQWSAAIPTAETIEAAGTCYVWYYIKGDAEHSDTDPVPLAVTLLPEPTYAVEFAEGTDPNEWTASPNAGVTKGQPVTVNYSGSKKVIGVKAEKKAAGLLTLSVCGETIYYAEGETWAEAIQNHPTENQGWEIFDDVVTHKNLGYLFQNDDFVPGTAKIDPNASYSNGSI